MANKTANARIERERDVEVLIIEIINGKYLTEYKFPVEFLETIMTRLNNLHDEVRYILRSMVPSSIHVWPEGTREPKEKPEPETDNYTEDSPF